MFVEVFDFQISVVAAYVLTGMLFLAMLILPLRKVLLLTLIFLTLPSLDTPLAAIARFLRWGPLMGLLCHGFIGSMRAGVKPRPHTGEHTVVLLFCVLFVLSATWSIGATLTLEQGGMMIALLLGVFFVLWNSWVDEEEILALCSTLFILASLMFALEAVYQLKGLGKSYGDGRYAGVFTNPNGMGTAVAFLGPFVFWKHHTSNSPPTRAWCKGVGVMMVIGLLTSGSRSGFLGSVICMGFITCYVYRVKLIVLLGLLMIPLALLYLVGQQMDDETKEAIAQSRMLRLDTLSNLSDRLPLWDEGLDLVLERPYLGYGYGMSKFANLGRAETELTQAVFALRGANYHNAHLQLALDLGVVGLLLFWVFLFRVLRRGFRIYRDGVQDPLHLAGIVFFGAFLALTGDSVVHAWAFSPGSSMSIIFFLMAAATVRIHTFTEAAAREEEGEDDDEETEAPPPANSPRADLIRS